MSSFLSPLGRMAMSSVYFFYSLASVGLLTPTVQQGQTFVQHTSGRGETVSIHE